MKKVLIFFFVHSILLFAIFVSEPLAKDSSFEEALKLIEKIEYRQAEPLFLKAIESGNLSKEETIMAREYLAEIYISQGNSEAAESQYLEILMLNKTYSPKELLSPPLRKTLKAAKSKYLVISSESTPTPRPPKVAKVKIKNKPKTKTGMSSKGRKTLGWTLVGIGGGLIVGGGVSYMLAGQKNDEFKNVDNADDANSARDAGQMYETIGMTTIGLGVVSTGIGIYFLIPTSGGKSASNSGDGIFAGVSTDGKSHLAAFGWSW